LTLSPRRTFPGLAGRRGFGAGLTRPDAPGRRGFAFLRCCGRGFMTFQLARRTQTVLLAVPV